MAHHGHPFLWLAALGLGGYALYRYGANLQPAVNVAAPGSTIVTPDYSSSSAGAVFDPTVDPTWQVEPSQVIAATEAATGINSPFPALVAAYPRGAVTEEYWAWLNRAPDQAGEAYWLDWIAQRQAAGLPPLQTATDLITAFQTSPEAKTVH